MKLSGGARHPGHPPVFPASEIDRGSTTGDTRLWPVKSGETDEEVDDEYRHGGGDGSGFGTGLG